MNMKYQTKGNTTPKGKKYIFIHAARGDEKLREKVFSKLLALEQGQRYCLWYTDEPGGVLSGEGREQLRDMALFIPLITENYFSLLKENGSGKSSSALFDEIQLQGSAILPLLESAENIPRFNRIFGDIHGIALTIPDADRMVEEQLKRLLSDDILEDHITKEAFAGKLFLSYRKKDIKEARKIMKAIHDTDAAGAAAIWFDEFLVAGRDFNDDIMKNLESCDAMALSVTPHLLEEGNYVLEKEYPAAVEHGIEVLPVEVVRTDDEKLGAAYPGIKTRVYVDDKSAMEEMLRKAGFKGAGSRSAFAEYLLGMAFFIPVSVEKDVDRAIQLFKTSAGHQCAEACEQLAGLYLRGIGVKRDYDEAIRYKKQAFDILMKEKVSEENLRHINRLFYEFDGLPLLLKGNDRVQEANKIQQAFLDRIESSPYKDKDEFVLCRVNALTDLANLFYEYDLETGKQKNSGSSGWKGSDEERFRTAEQYADKALALLDSYHGKDQDMATFLKVVACDQFADLCKYRNDLEGAIRYKQKSLELIEPLAASTGNLEYMDRSFQVSNNLGLFYREADDQSSAEYHIDEAVSKARQLDKINPEYKGRLVHALSNRALLVTNPARKSAFTLECYEVFLNLLKDMGVSAEQAWSLRNIGGEYSAAVYNIGHFTKASDRKTVYDRVYANADLGMSDVISSIEDQIDSSKMRAGCLQWLIILPVIVCAILQCTGLVDVTGLLKGILGPHGTLIAGGVVVFLYLLTCIPGRK